MARQYKVRLGDGTLLAVDLIGLRAWLYDDKARVQRVGSRRWRTLKDMIETETAAAAAAASAPRHVPPAPPKPTPDESVAASDVGTAQTEEIIAKPGANVAILPPDALDEGEVPLAAVESEEEVQIPSGEEIAIPPDREIAIRPEPVVAIRTEPIAIRIEPIAIQSEPVVTIRSKAVDLGAVASSAAREPAAVKVATAVPKPVAPVAKPTAPIAKPAPATAKPVSGPVAPVVSRKLARPPEEAAAVTPVDPIDLGDVARDAVRVPFAQFTPPRSQRPPERDGGMPIIPFKPLDARDEEDVLEELELIEEKEPVKIPPLAKTLLDNASAWFARITAPRPPRPEPAKPPPPVSELPSLRLAPLDEDRPQRRPWPKRGILIAAALVGGLAVVGSVLVWLSTFGLFSRKVAPAPPAPASTPSPQATEAPVPPELQAAAEQLPHLTPETIRLVASTLDLGPLDPPEVFRRAHLSANRGTSALPDDEARELRSLRSAVVGALRPIERERVQAYDRVSVGRDLLQGEDARVLRLYARGVRALSAPRRERLQALLGKAIAAALTKNPPRADAPPRPEPGR